ncbi:MAG: hypothetical protein ACTSQB_00175 [Candidatus Heimdallarchaeota archaeon]
MTIKINLRGLEKFIKLVREGLRMGGSGPMDSFLKRIGVRYLAFVRRRFVHHSQGMGDWPPLSPATIARRRGGQRRKKRGGGTTTRGTATKVAILRDTGTLLNALTVGMPGNLLKRIHHGVRVGFGGPGRHPKGKATIRDIAAFHNLGKGVPKRRIIVAPEQELHVQIQRDLNVFFKKAGGQCKI